MQDRDYRIRTMNRDEVDIAVEWAAQEGWNPGLHDADCFYAADSSGFLIGLLGDEPVATLSAVKYGQSFGFIGFYIVKPQYRGRGYGMEIWNAGLKYLQGRNIGLDGVVAQQENYHKSGFTLAYRNVRYQGCGRSHHSRPAGIVELAGLPFEAIEAYDRSCFPAPRTRFLQSWIRQPGCCALGIVQNGVIVGYGVARKCRSGYKIGPLFADDPQLGETLFLTLRSEIGPETPFYLDVPDVNQAAGALARRYDMKVVFETARMYTRAKPCIPLDRLLGVTSFELG